MVEWADAALDLAEAAEFLGGHVWSSPDVSGVERGLAALLDVRAVLRGTGSGLLYRRVMRALSDAVSGAWLYLQAASPTLALQALQDTRRAEALALLAAEFERRQALGVPLGRAADVVAELAPMWGTAEAVAVVVALGDVAELVDGGKCACVALRDGWPAGVPADRDRVAIRHGRLVAVPETFADGVCLSVRFAVSDLNAPSGVGSTWWAAGNDALTWPLGPYRAKEALAMRAADILDQWRKEVQG